jgi:DNA-binding response OmpR family regulator
MTRHLLVVEDEPAIAFALEADLTAEGYRVTVAANGDDGLALARTSGVDLVLLDAMLPGRDGFDVCRDLRRAGVRTPIIMLTARTHDAEKVLGLEMGADDYVTKPYNPRELKARIKAVLRRASPDDAEMVQLGEVIVDVARCEVRRNGTRVDLSATEFKLLAAFLRSKGRVLSREQLLDAAWGPDIALNDRAVDNHIVSLRRKIEADPTQPRHLVNVRGVGYRFDA